MELTVLAFVFFCKIIKQCCLLGAKGVSFWFGVCSKREGKPLWACRGHEQAHEQNWLEKSMISVTSHNHSCAHMQLCAPLPRSLMTTLSSRGVEIKKVCDWYVCMCVCVCTAHT